MITRKHPLAKCELCPLYKKDYVPTSGPANAQVAFVSRSPGYHDTLHRRPFAGPSGRVLTHLLEANGTTRDKVLTTNVVLCYHDGSPSQEAVEACSDRLNSEIAECKTVIAGGVEAVHSLISPRWSIASARGKVHNQPSGQRRIATTNPAVVLRESGNYPDMVRDFRLALNPTPPPKMPKVWYTDDADEAIEMLMSLPAMAAFDGTSTMASDLETFGWGPKIACAGFAFNTSMAYVIGFKALQDEWVLDELKTLYHNTDLEWVWHNGKFDIKVLHRNGIKARIDQDTFLLSYALDERPGGNYQGDQGAGLHALTPTLMQVYGWPDYEHNSVKAFKKLHLLAQPLELYDYNGKDTVGTLVLLNDLVPAAIADEVYERPYINTMIPLANALVDIELRGFYYDVQAAADLNEREVIPKIIELKVAMRQLLGLELYNPNSYKQNQGIFYERYQLKHSLQDTRKHVKTTSTDKDVTKEILEGRFEVAPGKAVEFVRYVQLLAEYRKLEKTRSTYIESLINQVADDGKLYTTFKFGTETGRLSSEKPNFQNITREGPHGLPSLRSLFLPSPGNVLVSVDLSQAELRTIAVVAQCKGLLDIYRDSTRSLHKERAAQFFGPNYTKEEYVKSKNINFGVSYLQSAFTFAQMYNMPQEQAQAYIDDWFSNFPEIRTWHANVVTTLKENDGVIVSPFGHKRRFHLITHENEQEVIKQAINFVPQNVAGVATEHALIELVRAGVPVVTSTHDSIVADVHVDNSERVALLMQQVMERVVIEQLGWTEIPFTADISIGTNWGNVEEVQLVDKEVAA